MNNKVCYIGWMCEVQRHGNKFEEIVLKDIFGINKGDINYTNCFDLPCSMNSIGDFNLSIKTTKNNTVCCGDYKNYLNYEDNNPYHSLIMFYQQVDNRKIIKEILYINNDIFIHAMKNLDLQRLYNLDRFIKNIENYRRPTIEESNFYKQEAKEITLNSIIKLNPKVDSKKQRRLQWSFSVKEVITKYPSCIINRSMINENNRMIFGREIRTIEISSSQRRFKNNF